MGRGVRETRAPWTPGGVSGQEAPDRDRGLEKVGIGRTCIFLFSCPLSMILLRGWAASGTTA